MSEVDPHAPDPDPDLRTVRVDVTNLWQEPQSPRTVDASAVADEPDDEHWLGLLDAHADDSESGDGRLGLHGRLVTQAVRGEPLLVVGTDPAHPGWVLVCAPWQPSRLDPRGYPGWVRASHLTDAPATGPDVVPLDVGVGSRGVGEVEHPLLLLARRHLGLPYLWGGVSPSGLDCSGLVHWCHRELGVVVPRDADDQQDACCAVPLDEVRPGDLYFFRQPGSAFAHHVGVVTRAGSMIHAPETGLGIVEEPLDEARRATLHGAGRLLPAADGP